VSQKTPGSALKEPKYQLNHIYWYLSKMIFKHAVKNRTNSENYVKHNAKHIMHQQCTEHWNFNHWKSQLV